MATKPAITCEIDNALNRWRVKLRKARIDYDTASHNGSFRGETLANDEIKMCEEVIADLTNIREVTNA